MIHSTGCRTSMEAEPEKLDGKRILVTGATGLIGSNLVRRLAKLPGTEVVACGRSIGKLNKVFGAEAGMGMKRFEHDIANPIPLELGEFDFVFHAAAPISGRDIRMKPVSTIAANIRGIENCLEHLRLQKEGLGKTGTIVVFSSATVYGSAGQDDRVCTEDDTAHGEILSSPTAPYSESKRMAEVIATAYHRQYGIGVKIARFGYVYGVCDIAPKTAFYEFVGKAVRGEDIVFNGSGFGRRDNIHVDDAVDGLLKICESGNDCEPYNVSSNGDLGNYAAIDEMAEMIVRAAEAEGIKTKLVIGHSATRSPGIRLDNSRLTNLGWEVRTPLERGVREVFSKMRRRNDTR